jgi:iron complex transport system substrate-binding protein
VLRRAFLVSVALLVACRSEPPREEPPRLRVVSLSPSTTEAVFALGAGALLVGRSRFCDYPPEALALPAVGGFADPSVEAIVALQPTLVVGARGPAGPGLERTLRERGIDTFFPETESLAQIDGMLAELGARLGHGADAERVRGDVRTRVEAVKQRVAGLPPVRAVMLFDVSPVFAAGPGGFPDELLRLAGGINVVTEGGAYPNLGLERLVALAPDVILDGAADMRGGGATGVAALREAPGWRELPAVRAGHIRPFDTSAALRPGPRIGDGLVAVARALHGDSFELP